MSYKHVFFGDLKKKIFNSKLDELSSDIIDEEERFNYFPNKFTNHELLGFSSLNLGVNIRVYNEDTTIMIFYLTEYDPLFYGSDILRNKDNSAGNIQMTIDKGDDKDMTITWIGIEERFRGKGLAKYLITLALLYTSIYAPDVKTIKLDDATDNYANGIEDEKKREEEQLKNLYCRMGFVYVDDNGPEMIGVTSELVKENIKLFVKKRERSLSKSRSMSSSGSRRKKRRATRSMSRSKRSVSRSMSRSKRSVSRSMSRSKRPVTRSMSRSRKKTKRT
jgi:ribosomal protein S18 acetylase RimI-like enzyme